MAKRKRERGSGDHGDDDDDDTTYGFRQILPVANLPIDFDGEPMDGLQYLFTVRRDARRLPNIKHVDNPYACSLPQPSPSSVQPCTENTQGIKAPPSLPSTEWRREFERHFRNLRGNISQPTIRPQQVGPFQKMMPDRKNRDAGGHSLRVLQSQRGIIRDQRNMEQIAAGHGRKLPRAPHLMTISHRCLESSRQRNCSN
ncbi:hypothetical protein BC826DRAFT_213833 [Russula brevipes]|nr:hypothetical protein BC826DRAFT_213833 [Russula brevipes]